MDEILFGSVTLKDLVTWVLPIISAIIAYFLAVAKFRKLKLWEEKYKLYQDMLNALETMKLWADETYCDTNMLPTIGTDGAEVLQSYKEARRTLTKISCIGALLISEKVIGSLKEIEGELAGEDFRFDGESSIYDPHEYQHVFGIHAKNIVNIIAPRLDAIITEAKKDLNKI